MKITSEVVTKEQFEVDVTPEKLPEVIGKIISGYGYHVYDCIPTMEISDNGDEINIELYKSEVGWDGLMKEVFAKDLMKKLKELK